jgi:hypothetical protein
MRKAARVRKDIFAYTCFFVYSVQCKRQAGEPQMKLVVHAIINRYVLSARVVHSNALLRFRFKRPLNLAFVRPGREMTLLEYHFSRSTHVINCQRVRECEALQSEHAARPKIV